MVNWKKRVFGLSCLIMGISSVSTAQELIDSNLKIEEVVSADAGLLNPVAMEFIGSNDFLVVEKSTGVVKRVTNGIVSPDPVLDLTVATAGESGLTEIVKSPTFDTDSYIYLFYTPSTVDGGPNTTLRLSRFTWNGTILTDETVIYTAPARSDGHFGGVISFGPPNLPPAEQKLFLGLGDQSQLSQAVNSAPSEAPNGTSVILRLNQDGTIPAGEDKGPFYDVAGANSTLQAMYSYGIRNVFGLAFDPVTNHLWDTENGDDIYDEINLVNPGFNSGYVDTQGPDARPDSKNTNPTAGTNPAAASNGKFQFSGVGEYADPKFSWRRCNGIADMIFLSDSHLSIGSEYQNDLLVTAYNFWGASDEGGKIFRFKLNEDTNPEVNRTEFVLTGGLADKVADELSTQDVVRNVEYTGPHDPAGSIVFAKNLGGVTDINVGPDGHIYLVSHSRATVYRILPKNTSVENWDIYN